MSVKKRITITIFFLFIIILLVIFFVVKKDGNKSVIKNPQEVMELTMKKMKEVGEFDFHSDLSIKINNDAFSKKENQSGKKYFNYEAIGHIKMPSDYYLKLNGFVKDREDIFEISSINQTKYTKFLIKDLINDKSVKYGLKSENIWKEIDPKFIVSSEKNNYYNVSLVFNSVDYFIDLSDYDFKTLKMFSETENSYYYRGDIISNKFREYVLAQMINAISPESVDNVYAQREIEIDKKTLLPNSEKFKIRITIKNNEQEEDAFVFEILTSFSNYGKEKRMEDFSDIDRVIRDKNLMISVTSSNSVDMQRKRNLYFIVKGLDDYYRNNKRYPISNSQINVDDENSPLRDLTPMYFLEGNLKSRDNDHHFIYKSDGKSYELSTFLEDNSDEWCVSEVGKCIYRIKNGVVVSKK